MMRRRPQLKHLQHQLRQKRNQGSTPQFGSMLKLAVKRPEELKWTYSKRHPRPPRTSELFALARRVRTDPARPSTSKIAPSTASFPASWLRAVTSRTAMELVECQFTARSLMTKTSPTSTLIEASSQWRTQDPTLMDPNSSCASRQRPT